MQTVRADEGATPRTRRKGWVTSTRAWHFQFNTRRIQVFQKVFWELSATEHANMSRVIRRHIREKLEIWNKKFHLHYALACANRGTSPASQLHLNGSLYCYHKKEKIQ